MLNSRYDGRTSSQGFITREMVEHVKEHPLEVISIVVHNTRVAFNNLDDATEYLKDIENTVFFADINFTFKNHVTVLKRILFDKESPTCLARLCWCAEYEATMPSHIREAILSVDPSQTSSSWQLFTKAGYFFDDEAGRKSVKYWMNEDEGMMTEVSNGSEMRKALLTLRRVDSVTA